MTYPSYPPPPGYPPQQPQYPPAQQPYYPPPQQQPQFAPPPPPAQHFDIGDFYDQPAASGKSIAGWFTTPGQSISGIIARAISKADIRAQTDMQTKQPRYYSDRTPMTTMTIPLLVQPSPDFPDGRAAWIINASDREDLDAAMQAVGCPPKTVPEAGAMVTITFTGLKQIPGFGVPKKIKRITYQRPPGAANGNGQTAPQAEQFVQQPAAYAVETPLPQAQPAYQPQYAQQPPPPQYQQAPPGQDPYAMATGQPPQQQYAQPDPTQQYATAPAPGPAQATVAPPATAANGQFAAPEGLSPEQEARLRALTGQ